MPQSIIRVLFAVLSMALFAGWIYAQERPLLTEDVDIIKPGSVRLQLGFDFDHTQRFGLSNLTGDLTQIGVVGFYFGLAPNVQFELTGTLQNFLNITNRGPAAVPLTLTDPNSTRGIGDFELATKIKLMNEAANRPAVGFRFGFVIPSSDQSRGIGTNTTNIYGTILLEKHFFQDRLKTFGNIGIEILTDPLKGTAQNDELIYGVAGIYKVNDRLNLVGEVHGRKSTRTPFPGTESLGEARVGVQIKAAGVQWDSAFIKGYTPFSPRYGITLGITSDFNVFTPIK